MPMSFAKGQMEDDNHQIESGREKVSKIDCLQPKTPIDNSNHAKLLEVPFFSLFLFFVVMS